MKNSIIIILLILFYIIQKYTTEKFENSTNMNTMNNSVCILLTTAVTPKAYYKTDKMNHHINNSNTRLELYKSVINEWLSKTNLLIHVVDSTGYKFEEYSNNPRVKICSFTNKTDMGGGPTPYEAISILTAFNYFKLINYDKIIKITGKYFIPDMEKIISKIPYDTDIIFQHTQGNYWQNSEIFGCKTKYLVSIMNMILEEFKKGKDFERSLYLLNNKRYKIYRLPVIKIKPTQRSDGFFLEKL